MGVTTVEVIEAFRDLIANDQGLSASLQTMQPLYDIQDARFDSGNVTTGRTASDMQDKALARKYPGIEVWCKRVMRTSKERLKAFDGCMEIVAEIRVTSDRLEQCWDQLSMYADAMRDVVERSAGSIGDGIYLDGEYETTFEPVRRGGLSFVQTAQFTCTVLLSKN